MLTAKAGPLAVICLLVFVCISSLSFHRQLRNMPVPFKPLLSKTKGRSTQKTLSAELPPSADNNCTGTWLQLLTDSAVNLTSPVEYSKRCIRAVPSRNAVRKSLTHVDQPLIPTTHTIDTNSCRQIEEIPCTPMELEVPISPPNEDASHMIFGASTTIKRLEGSISQWERWLAGNGAQLVVVVSGGNQTSLDAAEQKMLDRGINATVVAVDENLHPAQRHLSITEEIYQRRIIGHTEWHVVIDDDTFFPYMPAMIHRLRERYDSSKPWYVGALSEDEKAVKLFGMMAYGGGGIFMSAPLADEVHLGYDDCIQKDPRWGDIIIRDCIYKHSKTKLTVDNEFHQLDLSRDVSGFYELGIKPLSIHHWKSWSHLDVDKMHLVAEVCGECVLQRWQFADNFILSNGYSAAKYPKGIHFDVDLMEATIAHPNQEYDFSLNFRPKVGAREKLSFRLLDAEKLPDGSVRQLYLKPGKTRKDGLKSTIDEVVEVIWYQD